MKNTIKSVVSRMALHTHTHTHTPCLYKKIREERRSIFSSFSFLFGSEGGSREQLRKVSLLSRDLIG
jgi:hypothetical protein